jgi:hypothetical protein
VKPVKTQRKRSETVNRTGKERTHHRSDPSTTQNKTAQSRSNGIDDKEKVPPSEILKMRQIEVHRKAAVDQDNDKEFDQGCF